MTAPEAPEGFALPDWARPIDTAAAIEATPADITVKGMYLDALVKEADKHGIVLEGPDPDTPAPTYRAFKDYPLRELMELEARLGPLLFPDLPERDGLRRLGWTAYPTLVNSLIGKVIFGVLGNDIAKIFKISAKGYAVSVSRGRAEVLDAGPNHTHLRLLEMFNFADTFQIGVFEGAWRHYEREGEILVRYHSEIDIELFARWT